MSSLPNSNPPRPAISFRAMDPLAHGEDPSKTFCAADQAKATTATRLFRNEPMFKALRERALPVFLERAGRGGGAGGGGRPGGSGNAIFSLWSAGCSGGHETYSLAMECAAALWPHRLDFAGFGTDINQERIAEARAGRFLAKYLSYQSARYRDLTLRFTAPEGEWLRVDPQVRGRLRFGLFDLKQRPRRHTFDFIVCNHVLQYYEAAAQRGFGENMLAVLRPGGLLYLEGLTLAAREALPLTPVAGYTNLFARVP